MSVGSGAEYDDTHPIGVPEGLLPAPAPPAADAVLPGDGPAAAPAAGAEDVDRGLAAIRARDPDFDAEAFKGCLELLFLVVQEAWMECRAELARTVMSGPLLEQTLERFADYTRAGRRRVLEDVAVGEVDIISVASDATWDEVTARLRIAMADYDIDAASGRFLHGDRTVRERWEDWTFHRSTAARTSPGGGTMNRRCPGCGAPLDIDERGTCKYCREPVMNGAYDWVLVREDRVR